MVMVCVGKYPGGQTYRVLLKLLGMHTVTGSKGYSVLLAKLYSKGLSVWVFRYGKAMFILVNGVVLGGGYVLTRRRAKTRPTTTAT